MCDKCTQRKDICTLTFTAALFTIAKTWIQPKCSLTDELIKEDVIHTHTYTMKYYLAINKNEIMSLAVT